MTAENSLRDLGDGLVLRRATREDADALVAFNSMIHRRPGTSEPDVGIAAWTHDLVARPHPTTGPGDFTVVEDTRTSQIVSSLCLISQTWSYAGISFGVGRPELVGTLPEYRRRGLQRAISCFERVVARRFIERRERRAVIQLHVEQLHFDRCNSL